MVHRRAFLRGGTAAAFLALAAQPQAHAGQAVRIGLLVASSGPHSPSAADMQRGLDLFLAERDHALAGARVELFHADSGGLPARALERVRQLAEVNGIHALIGPFGAGDARAVEDYVRERRLPALSLAPGEDLERRQASPPFAAAYRKAYGMDPSAHAIATYESGAVLEAALAAIGGRAGDREALIAAVRAAQVASARAAAGSSLQS